jgi:uncharacterized protein YcsI (UPF0317 family)
MAAQYEPLRDMDVVSVRAAIRSGGYRSHTAGLARGVLQSNLAILPESYALDFMRYCQRNPKPCPLSGVSDTGSPMMFTLGRDIDIRSDVPAYNIYRNGELDATVNNISEVWTDDLVAFALGCSFTFEHALMRAGVKLWHIDNNTTVPMFRSNIDTVPAGPFHGKMVVSMRAVPAGQIDLVSEISRKFPLAHGGPVHAGDPDRIGIEDITKPEWGDPAPVTQGHVPVFWACGVTPQVAIEQASLPICITHKPGHMLITDIHEDWEIPVLGSQPQQPLFQQGVLK